MRVISGTARGKRLETLPGEEITRPTAERVKEGMFSAVQFTLPGAMVLDLFAGSGQLGIEALSRGAKLCVFVDQNRSASETVARNLKACGLYAASRVLTTTAEGYLAGTRDRFDLVFVDPPYRQGLAAQMLPAVDKVCADGADVFCETEREAAMPQACGGLQLVKTYRYGAVLIHRYRKQAGGEEC